MGSQQNRSARSFYAGVLEALIQVMGAWNGYLLQHGPRVSCIALRLGRSFGFSEEEQATLFFSSVLADLGMIGMVEEAWEHPEPILTEAARAEVRDHPLRSAGTVRGIPYLQAAEQLVACHHEWWDGTGYPCGLRGDEIPLGAQIIRLADTVAALGEVRPYRGPLPEAEIRRVVKESTGSEFSPEVGGRFLALMDEGEEDLFDPARFREALLDALDGLVPGDVSPVSARDLLELFAGLVDAKDPYTGGHSRRVASLARAVAEKMDLPGEVQERVWAAGFIHDMGKVSIPLRLLTKPGKLTKEEFTRVQGHTTLGARMTESIPSLQDLAPGCRSHHERWDGCGYPDGLAGDRIPVIAQILAVVDSYDAMTSGRAYRQSRCHGHALEEVDRGAGEQFSPAAAGAFLTLPFELFQEVKRRDPPIGAGPDLPFPERFYQGQRALMAQPGQETPPSPEAVARHLC